MRSKKELIIVVLLLICSGCASKEYTVTFETEGSNYMQNIQVDKGEDISKLEVPEKEGYVFVNWQRDGLPYDVNSPIKEDITLTANFIEAPELLGEYAIIFKSDNDISSTITVTEGQKVTKPQKPIKENYKFMGWYLDGEEFDFNTIIKRDLLLIAKYERISLTILYDLDGGSGIYSRTIGMGQTLPKPKNPIKFGYRFAGWTLNGEDYDFTKIVKENITLKAKWEKIEYVNITFDTDGGTEIAGITLEKGKTIENLPETSKEGFVFKYWTLDDEEFNNNKPIENDITLTAIYEENS